MSWIKLFLLNCEGALLENYGWLDLWSWVGLDFLIKSVVFVVIVGLDWGSLAMVKLDRRLIRTCIIDSCRCLLSSTNHFRTHVWIPKLLYDHLLVFLHWALKIVVGGCTWYLELRYLRARLLFKLMCLSGCKGILLEYVFILALFPLPLKALLAGSDLLIFQLLI